MHDSSRPEHPLTLNHLGILAEHVEQDLAKAAARYRKVASLGDVASQANFVTFIDQGREWTGILADESFFSSARSKYTCWIDRYNNGIPFNFDFLN